MQSKYDIHPEFSRFPVITIKFRGLLLWILNPLMRLQCFFVKRSLMTTLHNYRITRPDGTKLKVFTMTPAGLAKPSPALIYFHGGGFGLTYTSLHLRNCDRYAIEANCVVVFVDYRLAPKYPFPSGFDDCYASLDWAVQQAQSLGIDPQRIAVGGDSAGGALAAGVAQKARDQRLVDLRAQLLIYPVLDNSCSTVSAREFVDVPLFNAISNRNMWQVYLSPYIGTEIPPYAAPGHGQLQDLPLSYVETAEFDPLRDEALQHAGDLKKHGTEVILNETRGTVHGYDGNEASEIAKRSMLKRIDFLVAAFTRGARESTANQHQTLETMEQSQ